MPILYQVLTWLGLLLAGGTGGYLAIHPEVLTNAEPVSVWVEVVEAGVFADGEPLENSDELVEGAEVTTDTTGKAVLHFPDDSTVAVEPNTTLTVRESSYDEESRGIIARVFLTTGKLAFKIAELATPESLWETKTGNAVAVVRGTEFSVWFEDGTSSISVTSDTVAVATLDPETGEIVPGTEVEVTENLTAKVTDESARGGKAPTLRATPSPTEAPSGQTTPVPALQTTTPAPAATQPTVAPSPETTRTTPAAPATGASGGANTVSMLRLTLTPQSPRGVTDGDEVRFMATLHLSDGTTREAAKDVTWQVLGPIGTVRGGVFTAKLDPSTSEYGRGSGAVVAVWKDENGKEFLGKTDIFEVKGYIPENIQREG